jgi:methylmalonyl-CoA/ethylmalonyl-CoA epimerase
VTRAPIKINHVGLAVPDIEAFLRKTTPLYEGFSHGPMIVNERQKVRELYMTDGATTVELLEPLGEGSPLQGFLNRNPAGGLIHLALEVIDLDAAIARVTAAGGRLVVGPVPDVAFDERRIAFVYLGGQVTELVELPQYRSHTNVT